MNDELPVVQVHCHDPDHADFACPRCMTALDDDSEIPGCEENAVYTVVCPSKTCGHRFEVKRRIDIRVCYVTREMHREDWDWIYRGIHWSDHG